MQIKHECPQTQNGLALAEASEQNYNVTITRLKSEFFNHTTVFKNRLLIFKSSLVLRRYFTVHRCLSNAVLLCHGSRHFCPGTTVKTLTRHRLESNCIECNITMYPKLDVPPLPPLRLRLRYIRQPETMAKTTALHNGKRDIEIRFCNA